MICVRDRPEEMNLLGVKRDMGEGGRRVKEEKERGDNN